MKKIIYFLILGMLFSSCSHRVVRTGYQVKDSDYKTCDVIIKNGFTVSDSLAVKIGEIKLGESGFSTACSEEHAIRILKREACAVGADLIVITEENRPDILSSCYRCKASFYRFNSDFYVNSLKSDEIYNSGSVQERVEQDQATNTAAIIGGIVGGVLAALLFAH